MYLALIRQYNRILEINDLLFRKMVELLRNPDSCYMFPQCKENT